MSEAPPVVYVIELGPAWTECVCCELEVLHEFGIAAFEGEALPADYEGEWAGFPACRQAFEWAETLKAPAPLNESPCVTARDSLDDFLDLPGPNATE